MDDKLTLEFIVGKENLSTVSSMQQVFAYRNFGGQLVDPEVFWFKATDVIEVINKTNYGVSSSSDSSFGRLQQVNSLVPEGAILKIFSGRKASRLGDNKRAGLFIEMDSNAPLHEVKFQTVSSQCSLPYYYIRGRFKIRKDFLSIFEEHQLKKPYKSMCIYYSEFSVNSLYEINELEPARVQEDNISFSRSVDVTGQEIVVPRAMTKRKVDI
jgi:hypothetical protein